MNIGQSVDLGLCWPPAMPDKGNKRRKITVIREIADLRAASGKCETHLSPSSGDSARHFDQRKANHMASRGYHYLVRKLREARHFPSA